jgi:hypothetical protein
MAGKGLPPTVRELLGHESLSMTLRHASLAPSTNTKTEAVDVVDNIINEDSTSHLLHNLRVEK